MKALFGSTLVSSPLFSKVPALDARLKERGGAGECWKRKERMPTLWNKPALHNHSQHWKHTLGFSKADWI